MSKVMTVQEAFKLKRDSEVYVEQWKNAKKQVDPLLKEWKEHIEKSAEKTRA